MTFDAKVYCKLCGEEIVYPSEYPPDEYVFDHLYKHVSKLYVKRKPKETSDPTEKLGKKRNKQIKEAVNYVLKGKK